MDESYELEGRKAATPRVGNEAVAVGIEEAGPSAVVCRGCAYWLTRVGEGVVCSECGLPVSESVKENWIGGAERGAVERLRASAKWTVFGLGGLMGVVGLMVAVGTLGILRSELMAMMMALLGVVGGGMTYVVMQWRTQRLMRWMSGRGRAWLVLSLIGTIGAGAWLVYLGVMAVSELVGASPRGGMVDVFQFLTLWVGPPSVMVMMGAGGAGFAGWSRVLGNDQGFVKGAAVVAGAVGGLACGVMFAGIIVNEVVTPLMWQGSGADPTWRVVRNYAQLGAVIGGICAGAMLLVNGAVWALVWRRCGWVLRERAKAEAGSGES